MLLKFAINEIESFDNAARTFVNDGNPFEVENHLGEDMLRTTAKIRRKGSGEKGKIVFETVSVFEKFEDVPKESLLPENFPHRDKLEKNKVKTFEQLFALDLGGLVKLNFIGDKLAGEIIAARDGYNEDGTVKSDPGAPGTGEDTTNAGTGETNEGGEPQ